MILATLCYVQKNGKTLMMHRTKRDRDIHQGKWNGLGGKMHAHETPEACVIREVKEESGLTLYRPRLRGVLTFPDFDGKQDWYAFLFTANEYEGELIECDEGHLEWIEDDKLGGLPLWEGDYLFFEWLKKGLFFSAKFVYREGKLQEHSVCFY